MIKNFEELWEAHFKWSLGILTKEVKSFKTVDIYLGNIPDIWNNFALPKVINPTDLDFEEIKTNLTPYSPSSTIYLHEKQAKGGFKEFLLQNNYRFSGTDTWLVFNPKAARDLTIKAQVEKIGLAKFPDFGRLTLEVFKEEGYDDSVYNEICRKSLTGEIKSQVPDFSSEFFMIYEDGQPAAGAGLFSTDKLGYLHNDATAKEYRGKGYQTALIKRRVELCLKRRIETIFSVVENESQSFKNYQKCGFETWQIGQLFVRK